MIPPMQAPDSILFDDFFVNDYAYKGRRRKEAILNDTMARRLEALRKIMAEKLLDAFMVLKGENRRYLSGFTGTDSQLDESAGATFYQRQQTYPWQPTRGMTYRQRQRQRDMIFSATGRGLPKPCLKSAPSSMPNAVGV